MHQHVSCFQSLCDVLVCLLEVPLDPFRLAVVQLQYLVVDVSWVVQLQPSSSRHDSPDIGGIQRLPVES